MSDSYKETSLGKLLGNMKKRGEIESGLVERCTSAYKKKIKDLSINDIRTLILQRIGLRYLLPIAFDFLDKNPLTSSGLHRGELLASVLNVPSEFWLENIDLKYRMADIKIEIDDIYDALTNDILPYMEKF